MNQDANSTKSSASQPLNTFPDSEFKLDNDQTPLINNIGSPTTNHPCSSDLDAPQLATPPPPTQPRIPATPRKSSTSSRVFNTYIRQNQRFNEEIDNLHFSSLKISTPLKYTNDRVCSNCEKPLSTGTNLLCYGCQFTQSPTIQYQLRKEIMALKGPGRISHNKPTSDSTTPYSKAICTRFKKPTVF